ncbi:MAG: polyprenyl synthetase family protein [Bacteriovoracia bacterium]
MNLEQPFQKALEKYLDKPTDPTPRNLADSIRYSLLAEGKRIRPRLAIACGEMLGLPLDTTLPPALAIEMIHCFTLIHDDLPCMDDDDFRRGKPSNHKVYGEALALLAGDSLMPLATEVFSEAAEFVAPANFMAGLRRYLDAVGPRGVMGGQAAEFNLSAKSSFEELRHMHRKKTGALFEAAILIPKDFAGISDTSPQGAAICRFAEELGMGFQVADDFEDIEQDKVKNGADGQMKPTSILHYMSHKEAVDYASSRMRAAHQQLEQHLGPKCAILLKISEEVLRRIKKA